MVELFKKKGLPNGFKCIILLTDIFLTLTMGGNMTVLTVNGVNQVVDAPGDTRLLWVIREHLRLTGTKFGCGLGLCGACTVHLNGEAVRSCQIEIADAEGAQITTIEGLDGRGEHPVQQAWLELQVPQCGYCQSGQILAAVSLLSRKANPTDADIDRGMLNLCRCGTYTRVRKAIHVAAEMMREA